MNRFGAFIASTPGKVALVAVLGAVLLVVGVVLTTGGGVVLTTGGGEEPERTAGQTLFRAFATSVKESRASITRG